MVVVSELNSIIPSWNLVTSVGKKFFHAKRVPYASANVARVRISITPSTGSLDPPPPLLCDTEPDSPSTTVCCLKISKEDLDGMEVAANVWNFSSKASTLLAAELEVTFLAVGFTAEEIEFPPSAVFATDLDDISLRIFSDSYVIANKKEQK